MSRFSPALRDLLAPAAEAARVALVDLDADEVPASLRRVVSHSGGRLPPPLAASLLEALDDDEWLRDRAAAELRPGLEGSAAAALLERGEGWWVKVAAELAESRPLNSAFLSHPSLTLPAWTAGGRSGRHHDHRL